MPIPPPGAPINTGNYDDAYTGLGLSGLAQGFTHGLELGHQWGDQADKLALEGRKLDNEAAWRRSTAENNAGLISERIKAMEAKMNATPAGQPISITDPNTGQQITALTDGHGGMKFIPIPKAAGGKGDPAVMDAINQAEEQYVGHIASGGRLSAIPGMLGKAIARMDPNSEQSDYHRTVVNLASMLPKKLSGRSNWPEIEAHMKNIPEFGPDAEKGKEYFEKLKVLAGGSAPTGGADSHAQAVAWAQANPNDPRSAEIMRINGR